MYFSGEVHPQRGTQEMDGQLEVVGARLKEMRLSKGLSIRDVSRHSGVPRTTLQDIESGKNKPGFDTLVALLEFFNVRLEEVYPPAAQFGLAREESLEKQAEMVPVEAERVGESM